MEQKVNAILKNVNVESKEYKAIEAAIKDCWVGVDADNFLKQMKTKQQKLLVLLPQLFYFTHNNLLDYNCSIRF